MSMASGESLQCKWMLFEMQLYCGKPIARHEILQTVNCMAGKVWLVRYISAQLQPTPVGMNLFHLHLASYAYHTHCITTVVATQGANKLLSMHILHLYSYLSIHLQIWQCAHKFTKNVRRETETVPK